MADALKAQGNAAFAAKNYDEAIDKFTQAIELDSSNHVLFSNRSGVYASKRDYEKALQDAEKVTELKPDFAKGWGRKGAALHGSGDMLAALEAYEEALNLDPSNAGTKKSIETVKQAINKEATRGTGGEGGLGSDPMGGLGNMFSDPNLRQKLANNPKTSNLVQDQEFMNKLERMKSNPSDIGSLIEDPRMMQVMSVLLGIDMQFGDPSGGKSGGAAEAEEDVPMPDARPSKAATPPPEPEPEDEETIAKKKAKAEADAEKQIGNDFYKKREFDSAIEHYTKAWEIHKDITYLNNLGAAKYEKGDYQGAVDTCEQAVKEGREMLADFKLVAKAFGRIGSAYEKLKDLPNAIKNYHSALTEHRTPDILAKLRAAEKTRVETEKNAYIDPGKAEEARELGNAKFKEADWPAAVDAFSEAIKRAPDDPRGYSNRAATFIKLMTFPSAVSDCDAALKLDPTFVRAYHRKAQAFFAMREYSKCIDTCTEGLEQNPPLAIKRELDQQLQKAMQTMNSSRGDETEEQTMARIQKDPEILGILQDPVMQSILQQAKGDPAALQEHMKNSQIRTKIQKLIAAGVIRLGR